MGVLDKFLDMMSLNDPEDDYDDDEFFDEEDDYAEEKPARRRGGLLKRRTVEDDDLADDEGETLPARRSQESAKPRASRFSPKVMPMRQNRRGSSNMEVRVIRPTSYEDARDIAETLMSGRTVVLNLEGLDLEIAQRIIDFTSGTCFALTGNLQKISQYIFLLTPSNVDISGDMTDLLSGSFDVPSVRVDY